MSPAMRPLWGLALMIALLGCRRPKPGEPQTAERQIEASARP